MKKLYFLFFFIAAISFVSRAQTPTVQDCLGAIPLYQTVYYQDSSFSGEGNFLNEISSAGCPASCLLTGEKNDVWYVFTVQASGNLCFNIIPNSSSDDYDWAVYNLTNSVCDSIFSDSSLQVSCNYSSIGDTTGANGLDSISCASATQGCNNDIIPVLSGETYVLNVSNYSATQSGYTLDFSCTDSTIITSLFSAAKPPGKTVSLYPNPADDIATVSFVAENNSVYRIAVFDMVGKTVLMTKTWTADANGKSEYNFSVSALPPGSYEMVLFFKNEIAGRVPLMVVR